MCRQCCLECRQADLSGLFFLSSSVAGYCLRSSGAQRSWQLRRGLPDDSLLCKSRSYYAWCCNSDKGRWTIPVYIWLPVFGGRQCLFLLRSLCLLVGFGQGVLQKHLNTCPYLYLPLMLVRKHRIIHQGDFLQPPHAVSFEESIPLACTTGVPSPPWPWIRDPSEPSSKTFDAALCHVHSRCSKR